MGAPGCDDAPVVRVQRRAAPRDLTVVLPYYENPETLRLRLSQFAAYPDEFRTCVNVIVVDDGSPEHPAADVIDRDTARTRLFGNVRLFRIHEDVRWNWLAARNIGARHARDQWLLLTDIDHEIPADTMRAAVFGDLSRETIYRFSRTGDKTHPHPNSWLMTREMFWRVGGYDEALSGFYGTDGEYRRRCAATAPIRILEEPLVLREFSGDSSTTRYLRKQPEDAAVKRMIRARSSSWRPRTLSFPHHEVIL